MTNEQLIMKQLLEIKEDIGSFDAKITNLRSDVTSIENTLKESFIIPISNKIIIAFVIVAGTGIGASELSLI